MASRRKIAIIYQYNENWIGGTYYIENLIKSLTTLPTKQQPELHIFTKNIDEFERLSFITKYPFLKKGTVLRKISLITRFINKISFRYCKFFIISPYRKDIQICFPVDIEYPLLKYTINLYWIPDFQEHYLPTFFSEEEVAQRKKNQRKIINKGKYIVFSSNTARKHFNEIYPDSKINQFVLPFAVSHNLQSNNHNILEKYDLQPKYFICSNQFWRHKNHLIVLKALSILKQQGKEVVVVFTGKEYDYRFKGYFDELQQYSFENRLTKNIKYLGFIERQDQLWLMKNAEAVIQPSLFEGWSTVIEDAKSLNTMIIASNLEVHREQLLRYSSHLLFESNNAFSLAEQMQSINKVGISNYNYTIDIVNFGKTFYNISEFIISRA